jgi:hypothetical protein
MKITFQNSTMMHETHISIEKCQTMTIFCVHCSMHSPYSQCNVVIISMLLDLKLKLDMEGLVMDTLLYQHIVGGKVICLT